MRGSRHSSRNGIPGSSVNDMINPDVARTMDSPISEAYSWIAGRSFPPDRPLIDVSQAVPGYPPAPALIEHLAEHLSTPALSRYGAVLGRDDVRAAFAADVNAAYDAEVDAEQVAITSGANHAFAVVANVLAQPGDEIILPVPYYFNHDMWLQMHGIRARYLPCGAGMLPDPELAASLINERTKAALLITPNNPTGTAYPPELIRAFSDVCRDAGIVLILDETYRDFRTTTDPPHDLFRGDWTDHVIHIYSFSKTFSITGFRVGAIAADTSFLTQVDKFADCVTICPPLPGQEAALYGMTHLGDWVAANRELMSGRVAKFRAEMREVDTGYTIESAGAYFAYVRHPYDGEPSRTVARRLADDHNILALAGEMFGPGQESFLRLAFANLDDHVIPELVARLAERW